MKEIYRSFEGKLDVDCQNGYILYAINDGDLIEYEGLSVWADIKTERARIPARYLPASPPAISPHPIMTTSIKSAS